MTFRATIREVEVQVHAEEWDGDDSVGIPYGPEVVYAKTIDGQDFELTDAESDAMAIRAIEIHWDSYED